MNDLRRAIVQANFNEKYAGWFITQIFIVACVTGAVAQSWWVFGGTLLGLFAAIQIPRVGVVLCVLFGLGWGLLAGILIYNDSASAGWVIGILVFLGATGANLAGLQWAEDM